MWDGIHARDMAKAKQICSILLSEGALSKTELASRLGLSFPTVGGIVDALVNSGRVFEHGKYNRTGGRSAMRYRINTLATLRLLMRFEASELSYKVIDMVGEAVFSGACACTENRLAAIDSRISELCAKYPEIGAVALGLSARVIHKGELIYILGIDELLDMELNAHFTRTCAVPVVVENDMNTVAAGCWKRMDLRSPAAVVCLYRRRAGAGAGLVINGEVWYGMANFAGELRHLLTHADANSTDIIYASESDMLADYAALVRAYAVTLNPECMVIYNSDIEAKLGAIRQLCEPLPQGAMPRIEVSQDFVADYERGLAALANAAMNINRANSVG